MTPLVLHTMTITFTVSMKIMQADTTSTNYQPQIHLTYTLVICLRVTLCTLHPPMSQMVESVGEHVILCALMGVVEKRLREQVSALRKDLNMVDRLITVKVNPSTACGFCGRSCHAPVLNIAGQGKRRKMEFSCLRKQDFQYGTAIKSTTRQPSTNVPVQCTLRPPMDNKQYPTFWKYAMFAHIQLDHPRNWNSIDHQPQDLITTLLSDLTISSEEVLAIMKNKALPIPATSESTTGIPVSLPYPALPHPDMVQSRGSKRLSSTLTAPTPKRRKV